MIYCLKLSSCSSPRYTWLKRQKYDICRGTLHGPNFNQGPLQFVHPSFTPRRDATVYCTYLLQNCNVNLNWIFFSNPSSDRIGWTSNPDKHRPKQQFLGCLISSEGKCGIFCNFNTSIQIVCVLSIHNVLVSWQTPILTSPMSSTSH